MTDKLTRGGALWHGVSTRFTVAGDDAVPYTRVVLRLSCIGEPIAARSYGDCFQYVCDASRVTVKEVHFFRGLGFFTKGEHYFDCVGSAGEAWIQEPVRIVDVDFASLDHVSIAPDVALAYPTSESAPTAGRERVVGSGTPGSSTDPPRGTPLLKTVGIANQPGIPMPSGSVIWSEHM
ncbi:MAG: hypothetical protein GY772_14170, partial [bacterium]|nr:hypothetical protein [bacterium]